jgi:N6-L-threonylcarbamoyladenine synthase
MLVLGIESTAHTLGIGIVEDKKILSNDLDTYKPIGEGIVPRKAADHHASAFYSVLTKALEQAKINIRDIDLIAFAQGPGIGSPLRIGCFAARYLAKTFALPLVGVNHCFAHLAIAEALTSFHDPLYAYVSGGNTQTIVKEGNGFKVVGETLDIGMGNLFDNFARAIGLSYGHGSQLAKLAEHGKYVDLPYTVKGMDLVFCGLLTSAEKKIKTHKKEDLAFSLMETAFAMYCEVVERAMHLYGKKELILCGGVAQNKRLQEMMKGMCKENGWKFYVAPDEFNRDNGAMIAYAGYLLRAKATKDPLDWPAKQHYRIDEVRLC